MRAAVGHRPWPRHRPFSPQSRTLNSRFGSNCQAFLTYRRLNETDAPGNVLLRAAATRLDRGSVANVSLVVAVDKALLTERIGRVPGRKHEVVGVVLGDADR